MKKKYQNVLIALLPVCILLASTCKEGNLEGIKKIGLNSPFGIPVNEKAIISESGLLLEVSEINDSRCPINVECIWAGNSTVKLNVTSTGIEKTDFTFCIGQCENRLQEADTVLLQHQNQSYSFILKEVQPYPGQGSNKKTAIFLVKKN